MLKPMLARGELRMIGATTLNEYREFIEKDAALERRFQQVYVGEPTVEDTIAILRGLKQRYEAHHKVSISDSALVAAASLSHRYIPSRQLPDKAIDLIDEAASRLRMEIDSAPLEIDELRRHVDRLKLEELALKKEKDAAAKERLAALRATMAEQQEKLDELQARWETERASLNRVGDLKNKLDGARIQAERAQREGNLEKASRLLYGEIPGLERELADAEKAEQSDDRMVGDQVTDEDIAAVIAAWTGIPWGACCRASPRSCCTSRASSAAASSASARRSRPSPTPCAVRGRGCRIPTGPPDPSCSSDRRASARPSSRRRSPSSSSTMSRR